MGALEGILAERADSPQISADTKRQRPRWLFPLALVVVAALLAAAVPAFLGLLEVALRPMMTSASTVAAQLEAIPGVASVSDAEGRAGDLSFRANVFFTARGDDGLSPRAQDQLVDAISATLATAQGDTRYLVELDLGSVSVGISPVAALNSTRVDLARSLAAVPSVVRATVLWHTPGDDLIFDEDNQALALYVQAQHGTPLALLDASLPLTFGAEDPVLTAIILGTNSPRERLYSWGDRGGPMRGEREVDSSAISAGEPGRRAAIEQLEVSADVLGFRVSSSGAILPFRPDVDVRQALDRLTLPAEWEVTIQSSAGDEGWTREPADTDPSAPRAGT